MTFTQNFDWHPARFGGRVTVAFKAGVTQTVTRECAAAALQAGAIKPDDSRKTEAHDPV